jgi:hypothetical protein
MPHKALSQRTHKSRVVWRPEVRRTSEAPRRLADVSQTACRPPLHSTVGFGGRPLRPTVRVAIRKSRPPGGMAIHQRTAVVDVRPNGRTRSMDVFRTRSSQKTSKVTTLHKSMWGWFLLACLDPPMFATK